MNYVTENEHKSIEITFSHTLTHCSKYDITSSSCYMSRPNCTDTGLVCTDYGVVFFGFRQFSYFSDSNYFDSKWPTLNFNLVDTVVARLYRIVPFKQQHLALIILVQTDRVENIAWENYRKCRKMSRLMCQLDAIGDLWKLRMWNFWTWKSISKSDRTLTHTKKIGIHIIVKMLRFTQNLKYWTFDYSREFIWVC